MGNYSREEAPPLEYLKTRPNLLLSRAVSAINKETTEVPPEEARWNARLEAYEFNLLDKFDLALADSVESGFFDPLAIDDVASDLDRQIRVGRSRNAWGQAWNLVHDSFDNGEEAVVAALDSALRENVEHLSLIDLDGIVGFLKKLERNEQAKTLIGFFLERHHEEVDLRKLTEFPYERQVEDNEIREAVAKKLGEFETSKQDVVKILMGFASRDSWNTKNAVTLTNLSSDDFYNIFKKERGHELRAMIYACQTFATIRYPGDQAQETMMREISRRANEALMRIAGESRLNRLRVTMLGVVVPEDPSAGEEDNAR
jgi:hypothetical protein